MAAIERLQEGAECFMSRSMVSFIAAVAGGFADSLMTLYAMKRFGADVEDNSLIRALFSRIGWVACFFPFLAFAALAVLAYHFALTSALLVLAVISWTVVSWNAVAIAINHRRE